MEKMQYVGQRKLDFTDRSTGEVIAGVKLYFLRKFTPEEEGCSGMCPENWFFKPQSPFYTACDSWKIGAEVAIDFDRKGKPQTITPLEDEKKK